MANYKELIPFVLHWEGGFVNDKTDRGGATMKGVTLKTYTAYRVRKGMCEPTIDDLKNISDSEWGDIFKKQYWDRCKADRIQSQSVANMIVDWAYNSGIGNVIPCVQRVLGLKDDGLVGDKTLSAINSGSAYELFGLIKAARVTYYKRIVDNHPEQGKYYAGWINRTNSLKF